MREHVKPEVALEILSMCLALAIKEKNIEEIKQFEELKRRLYKGEMQVVDIVLNEYGSKVKSALEVIKNDD